MIRALHRAALRAYPREFRAEFAAELERIFDARLRAARAHSRTRAALLAIFQIADALISGLAERFRRLAEWWAWPRHADARRQKRTPVMTWESIAADVRLTRRTLRRAPVFAVLTIATLALGIGANSAIFAVVHAVLLRPLPYEAPDRLIAIWSDNSKQSAPDNPVSPANFEAFRAAPSLDRVEGLYSFLIPTQMRVGTGDIEIVQTSAVTPEMFSLLGRAPLHGSTFRADDPSGVVLSYEYWQRRFGGDPHVIGQRITAGTAPNVEIRGVMPAGFVFPYRSMLGPSGFTRALTAEMWIPLVRTFEPRLVDATGQPNRTIHFLAAIARLKPGATMAGATADLAAIATRRTADFPETNAGWGVTVRPLHEQAVGKLRPALVTLLAGVGVLLLITCMNVANVLLARATGQQRDLAIRSALGASRRRLMQQSLVESTLLGCAGGVAGLLMMTLATRAILALAPPQLPRLGEVSAGLPVLVFAAVISLFTGLIVGLLPALSASRSRAQDSLRDSHRTTASAARQRLRAALIVAEVAMAMALTVAAGLLLRSFVGVLRVDPGFAPDGLLTFQVSVPPHVQVDLASRQAFYEQLESRLRSLPGVTAVGGTTRLPLGSTSVTTYIDVEGRGYAPGERPEVEFRRAVWDFFGTMRIPIVRGRAFGPEDAAGAPVLINAALAARVFPTEDPIGRRIQPTGSPWMTIVGVVGAIRHGSLEETPRPEIYINYRQNPPSSPFIALRASVDPETLAAPVRSILRELGANPPTEVRTMAEIRSASVGERRFVLVLVGVFGGLALVLAGVGVYGVITLVAAERAPEVGIRLALGATPSAVLRLVMGQAVMLAVAGVAIGTAIGLLVAPALGAQLFGVGRADPLTYAGVAIVLVVIAAGAALVPSRRAMRIDPAATLRN